MIHRNSAFELLDEEVPFLFDVVVLQLPNLIVDSKRLLHAVLVHVDFSEFELLELLLQLLVLFLPNLLLLLDVLVPVFVVLDQFVGILQLLATRVTLFVLSDFSENLPLGKLVDLTLEVEDRFLLVFQLLLLVEQQILLGLHLIQQSVFLSAFLL